MNNFNPYMSSPNQGRNQSSGDSARNYGWDQPQKNYCCDYPAGDWRSNAYGKGRSYPQAENYRQHPGNSPQTTMQDRYDSRMCQLSIAKHAASGLVVGGAAGLSLGTRYCPPVVKMHCTAATTLGGAAIGCFGGAHSALEGPSCQSITRTFRDENGNGYTSYGSNN